MKASGNLRNIENGQAVNRVQLNKGTKSVIEIGPNYGDIYGLKVRAGSRSGAAR